MSDKGEKEEVSDSEHEETDVSSNGGEDLVFDQSQSGREQCAAVPAVVAAMETWDPQWDNLPSHPTIVAFGQRRTGKSTSFDNLLFHCFCDHLKFGIVMTETKRNGFWQERFPDWLVIQGWRDDILAWIKKRQDKAMREHGKDNPDIYMCVIFDDVISDQHAIRYSKVLNEFFTLGRHLRVTCLITSQYTKGIGPMLRTNADIVIMQPTYNVMERETLWANYAGIMHKNAFGVLMDLVATTEELDGHTERDPRLKVQVLVVLHYRQTNNPLKKFMKWQPVHSSALPAFKMLAPEYWKANELETTMHQKSKNRSVVDVLDECRTILTA